jgi:hypothetical protein
VVLEPSNGGLQGNSSLAGLGVLTQQACGVRPVRVVAQQAFGAEAWKACRLVSVLLMPITSTLL